MIPRIAVPLPDTGVLIASPRRQVRHKLIHRLWPGCERVREVGSGAAALARLEGEEWSWLVLDRRLPDLDAEELVRTIERRFPRVRVVLLDSSAGTQPALREGEPLEPVWKAEEPAARRLKNLAQSDPLPGMIGDSPAMAEVYQSARRVAGRTTTVLLTGASGTGKELVARGIHRISPRAAKALVVINCAALPEALLESELFGHTRGAFTGAVEAQAGRIQAAEGGTLFLDEVGELPLGLQAKLLRFLEGKEVQRLGCATVRRVDVRVVAATNADLVERVAARSFRADLYFRLCAYPIALPLLRERGPDILPLARHFLEQEAERSGVPVPELSAEAERLLECHSWEGNVRELEHVLERASILAEGEAWIGAEHLQFLPRQWAGIAGKNAPSGADCLEIS
jgi:transcriptional regulator with GAF, ATPase, and Fis domain